MRRIILYGLAALIPLVILWAIIAYFDPNRASPEISNTTPKWIEKSTHDTCDAAITGTLVTDQTPAIDQNRAARIGAGVIDSQTNLHTIAGKNVVPFLPVLVEHQFPDNQSRLAWAYGEVRVTDQYSMTAIAEVVYIDATTGDPLLLIKDIFAPDPTFSCSQINNASASQFVGLIRQILLYAGGLVVTIVYLIILGLHVRRLYRRRAVWTNERI